MISVKIGNNTLDPGMVRCWYDHILNEIGQFEVFLDGVNSYDRTNYARGNTIEFYDDSVLDLKGTIISVSNLEAGGLILRGVGAENEFANIPCDTTSLGTSGVWQNTASATIFTAIIGEASTWSAGTINAGVDADFKVSSIQSLWNGIQELRLKTGQDISMNYTTLALSILDTKGSSNITTLNEGVEISEPRYDINTPEGLKVLVFGKGDGENQITGSATNGSYAVGDPVKKIVDPSIISTDAANERASKELTAAEVEPEIYEFEVLNPDLAVVTGDTLTLNAPSAGASNKTVRVVRVRRGMKNKSEYLELEVTNSEYSKISRMRDSYVSRLAKIERDVREKGPIMQGSSNVLTYMTVRNIDSSTGAAVYCPIPASLITDEAGNKRVLSMTLDFDVDPFNAQYGTISGDTDNNSGLSVITSTGDDTNVGTLGSTYSTVKTYSVSASNHGQYINFNLNLGIYDHTTPTNTVSYKARIYDGTNYYPDSTGIRLARGSVRHTLSITGGSTNYAGSHDHESVGHTHSPYTGTWFMESDECINWDYCSSTTNLHQLSSDGSHTHTLSPTGYVDVPFSGSGTILCPVDPAGKTFYVQLDHSDAAGQTSNVGLRSDYQVHSRHYHPTSGGAADVVIGDGVDDSAAVNASQITVYVERLESGSWVNHYNFNISLASVTYGTDVDLTNSGTYPDDAGFWRVRVVTNNATPDLLQAVVKIKHEMDN